MRLELEMLLASWSASLQFDAIPEQVRLTALRCLTDCMGVALAGTRSDAYRRARAGLIAAPGDCRLIGQPVGAAAGEAAFLNGVAAHAYDFDDTCFAGIMHASAVVLPAALAAAQHQGACSGAELLSAFVAGVEVACRLGLVLTEQLYDNGHWTTGVLGVVGASAAVARVLRLSAEQTADALRLAVNFPIGVRAILGSESKPYLCGAAARTGLECAYAAGAGVRGNSGTLEGAVGFVQVINQGVLVLDALRGPDAPYCLADPGVAFKFFPMCSAGQAAAQAVLALRAEHALTAAQVASVTCYGTELVKVSLRYAKPDSLTQAQFSMPFAVACCLLHGKFGIAQLEDGTLRQPKMTALMENIELLQDDTLVPLAERMRYPEAARVVIRLRDGRELERTVLAACGMPDSPATPLQLEQKFIGCAAPVLGEHGARQLLLALGQLPGSATLDAVTNASGAVP